MTVVMMRQMSLENSVEKSEKKNDQDSVDILDAEISPCKTSDTVTRQHSIYTDSGNRKLLADEDTTHNRWSAYLDTCFSRHRYGRT